MLRHCRFYCSAHKQGKIVRVALFGRMTLTGRVRSITRPVVAAETRRVRDDERFMQHDGCRVEHVRQR